MPISAKTFDLIWHILRNFWRQEFILDKGRAQEPLLQTYDLLGLKRPERVVWLKSPAEAIFLSGSHRYGTRSKEASARFSSGATNSAISLCKVNSNSSNISYQAQLYIAHRLPNDPFHPGHAIYNSMPGY